MRGPSTVLQQPPGHETNRRDALSVLQPYAFALLLVGIALALTLALQHLYVGRPSFFPFFAAIAAAAWFGGKGPGYFAVAASTPLGLYIYSAAVPGRGIALSDLVLFLFFASCAFVGGALNTRRREAEQVLRKAHGELQAKAIQLQSVNEALVAEMAEHARTEAALETTRNELARAARLTSMAELAASIAHEINQPLAAVVTNAGACVRWLNAPMPDLGEAQQAAQRVVRDANRAGAVVAKVRTMVRSALAERTHISIAASLDEVLALLQPEIARQHVTIERAITANLQEVSGDRVQLQQVFVNLITNALDALAQSPEGDRTIRIGVETTESGVEISVRDNGIGLPTELRETLFQSFVTNKPGGMGMGLSICRTIVEAHGGTLTARDVEPHGAEFCIVLPHCGEAR